MKTPARQHSNIKRRNIAVVFVKAFSIFLWQLFCWCLVSIYRNSMKNPMAASGIFLFLLLFVFVAYNALFSQQGYHATPFFETRANPMQEQDIASIEGVVTNPQTNENDATSTSEVESLQTENAVETVAEQTTPPVNMQAISSSSQRELSLPVGKNIPIPIMMSNNENSFSQTSTSSARQVSHGSSDLLSLQKKMAEAGFYDGPIDGLNGPKTREAIAKWEKRKTSSTVVQTAAIGGRSANASVASDDPMSTNSIRPISTQNNAISQNNRSHIQSNSMGGKTTQADIFRVQTGLRLFGHNKVAITGVEDEETRNALKAFQKMYSLPQTGRISPELIAKMKEIGIFS